MSDRIGRKKTLVAGCRLAALTYVPIYMCMQRVGNPAGLTAWASQHRIDVERHA